MNYASKTKTKKNTPLKYTKPALLNRSRRTMNRSRQNMNSGYSIHPEKNIIIPKWAKIVEYRTMTSSKKDKATNGDEKCQIEWMFEEVNEFYEAIHDHKNEDIHDIEACKKNLDNVRDEAIGLIRTFQQFRNSKTVERLWKMVRNDVLIVFRSRRVFMITFKKWHEKKLLKGQAIGVVPEDLINIAHLRFEPSSRRYRSRV